MSIARIVNAQAGVLNSTPLRKFLRLETEEQTNVDLPAPAPTTSAPSTLSFISQMPNVSFSGRYHYGNDDLSEYDNYRGPQPPEIEIRKYRISCQVNNDINDENYLAAIKGKIELAQICHEQGKDSDAFLIEESIRKLYKDLPRYQKSEAKSAIQNYNYDMGKYIDQDIERD